MNISILMENNDEIKSPFLPSRDLRQQAAGKQSYVCLYIGACRRPGRRCPHRS